MSEGKRYYWLKLQEDFFSSIRIKKLRSIAGGDTYTIIYLKMQLKSLQENGILKYTGIENSFAEELALDIDEDPDNVAVTLQFLQSCGLIETSDNIEFMLPYAVNNMGSIGDGARRVREFRARQKMLQCNTDVTECNSAVTECNTEKEKELEREKEKKKIKKEKEKKSADADDAAFDQFWELYPRKVGKGEARRKFAKVIKQVNLEVILAAVKRQRESRQWSKDNGQFIPYPATWLNQERWEDEVDFGTVDSARNYDYDGEDSL